MADRIVKPDTGNDLVLQNDDASAKIEINEAGTIVHTGTSSIDVSGGTFTTSSAQKQAIVQAGPGSGTLDVSSGTFTTSTAQKQAIVQAGPGSGSLDVSGGTFTTSSAQKDAIVDGSTAISRSGNNLTFAGTVGNTGDNTVTSGNFVIGTAGKGIDFSVNSHASGMSSELLDSYEEGTWTPTITAQNGSLTSATATNGQYTKIGRTVTCSVFVTINTVGTGANAMVVSLPFVASSENFSGSGAERNVVGLMLAVFGETAGGTVNMHVRKYDFNSILVANYGMRIQATFLTS